MSDTKKRQESFVEAARQVLSELGGGPLSSKDLVSAAQERGLIDEGKWVYHNFLRAVRESEDFDTSQRGQVALSHNEVVEAPITAPQADLPAEEAEEFSTET